MIDEDERQSSEDAVHQTLESRPRILQAKRHLNKLEQAERCYDCSLWNVVRKHLDLVVPLHKIGGGNMWEPATLFMKSRMFGTGYLSGTVALLSR